MLKSGPLSDPHTASHVVVKSWRKCMDFLNRALFIHNSHLYNPHPLDRVCNTRQKSNYLKFSWTEILVLETWMERESEMRLWWWVMDLKGCCQVNISFQPSSSVKICRARSLPGKCQLRTPSYHSLSPGFKQAGEPPCCSQSGPGPATLVSHSKSSVTCTGQLWGSEGGEAFAGTKPK